MATFWLFPSEDEGAEEAIALEFRNDAHERVRLFLPERRSQSTAGEMDLGVTPSKLVKSDLPCRECGEQNGTDKRVVFHARLRASKSAGSEVLHERQVGNGDTITKGLAYQPAAAGKRWGHHGHHREVSKLDRARGITEQLLAPQGVVEPQGPTEIARSLSIPGSLSNFALTSTGA